MRVKIAKRHKSSEQGVGAGRNADGETSVAGSGDFLFQRFYFGPEDEVLRINNPFNGLGKLQLSL